MFNNFDLTQSDIEIFKFVDIFFCWDYFLQVTKDISILLFPISKKKYVFTTIFAAYFCRDSPPFLLRYLLDNIWHMSFSSSIFTVAHPVIFIYISSFISYTFLGRSHVAWRAASLIF